MCFFNRFLQKWIIGATAGLLGVSCVNGGNGTHSVEPMKKKSKEDIVSLSSPPSTGGGGALGRSAPGFASSAEPDKSELLIDFAKRLDLAHVRSSGLLIDFGTASRNKYTIGDWKTGWRGNYVLNGTTVSYVAGKATRVFFHLNSDEAGGGKVVLRGHGVGRSATGRLYLNGKSLGPLEFETEFSHAIKDVDGGLKAGTNEILLRFDKAERAEDGKLARLVVDYIRVIPTGVNESQAASSVESVLSSGEGGASTTLLLRNGDGLNYYVPVPKDAFLFASMRSVGAGKDAEISITASGTGLRNKELAHLKVDKKARTVLLPLSEFADNVCALTLNVNKGEVLFEKVQLRLPATPKNSASGKRSAANVVLVLIDTLRADHLSMYDNGSRVQTSFLDKFSKESMVFDRVWAQENWTKPSIASLLTGLYSATHQTKTEKNKIPSSAVMIQEHFSKLGFETAGFVANGYVSDKFGFRRGWNTWTNYVREGKRNRAEFVADDAVNWLKKRKEDKPFYLYVHTIDPHVPYIPPVKYRALYDNEPYNGVVKSTQTATLLEKIKTGAVRLSERDKIRLEALYDGEITYHDEHLEKIYRELEAQGLLENTVMAVTSDHGEEFFEHGSVGHGHTLYEELLHVPLFIRLPGAHTQKKAVHFPQEVELVDVLPTMCELLGIEVPDGVQGESLIPQLNGIEPRWPNAVFSEFMDGQLAARTERFKLIYRGLRTTLFDLKEDPRETSDLSDELPEALVLMRDVLGLHMGMFSPGGVLESNGEKKNNATKNKAKVKVHQREEAVIDTQTRKQLEALGYMGE